ncbi:MAG: hypothetical protein EBQ96_07410 [Proteobacteria bacterium]|nr:hypothetical protein [Pseudomonadota bacterium]
MTKSRNVVTVKSAVVSQEPLRYALAALVLLGALLFSFAANAASAPSVLEQYAIVTGDKTNIFVDILAYVSFIMGIVLAALGVNALRMSAENPQNQLKLGVIKLAFGGIFLAFPFLLDIAIDTMGGYDFSPLQLITRNRFFFDPSAIKQTGAISGLIVNSINSVTVLVNVAAFCAFLIGTWFVLRGLQMLKTHMENPQNAPLPEAVKRLAVGGAMLSLPMIAKIVVETFGALGARQGNNGFAVSSSGGLDGLMVNFIKDISNPAYLAIEIFCYISGILLILFAMQKLVKTAQDGPNGPLGFGTIATFIVAGLLLSFPQLLGSLSSTIFGSAVAKTQVQLMSLSGAINDAQAANAKNVFSAVLAFMAVIGFLSVVRGLFLFRAFAQGNNQATMMSIVTHIVAGALCVNLGGFINAVQKSLGLTTANIPLTFS